MEKEEEEEHKKARTIAHMHIQTKLRRRLNRKRESEYP